MKINALVFVGLLASSVQAHCNTASVTNTAGSFNLSVQTKVGALHCLVD